MAAVDDTHLLERLLKGEQRAYKELVVTYQSAMRAVAYAIVGQRHADEVVQDAWLSVVRNLGKFEGRSSLKTWLLTITANAAKGRYKQNRRPTAPSAMIASAPTTVTGLLPRMPGTRTRRKRCSPKTNCANAWNIRYSVCRNCKAACWCCASARAWNWKRSVIS